MVLLDDPNQGNGGAFVYDANFKGPTSNRFRTDRPFAIFFGLVFLAWLSLGLYVVFGPDGAAVIPADRHTFSFGRIVADYWSSLVAGIILAQIVVLFVVIVMRWVPRVVIATFAVLLFYTIAKDITISFQRYFEFRRTNEAKANQKLAIGCGGLAMYAIIFIWMFRHWQQVQLSIKLICESNRSALRQFWSVAFIPILPAALQSFLFFCAVFFSAVLSNSEQFQSTAPLIHMFNVFVFFWTATFITSVTKLTLAGIYGHWYWTYKKDEVSIAVYGQALSRALKYHTGTAAFSSVAGGYGRNLRIVMCVDLDDNRCSRFVRQDCNRVLRSITDNAVVMCAIHGKPLCNSGLLAYQLLARNRLPAVSLNSTTRFVVFVCRLVLCIGIGILPMFNDFMVDTRFVLVPVFLLGAGIFKISETYLSVYSAAVDTMVMCFLEDIERNDGSEERPYYMSKQLKSILIGTDDEEGRNRVIYNHY